MYDISQHIPRLMKQENASIYNSFSCLNRFSVNMNIICKHPYKKYGIHLKTELVLLLLLLLLRQACGESFLGPLGTSWTFRYLLNL